MFTAVEEKLSGSNSRLQCSEMSTSALKVEIGRMWKRSAEWVRTA